MGTRLDRVDDRISKLDDHITKLVDKVDSLALHVQAISLQVQAINTKLSIFSWVDGTIWFLVLVTLWAMRFVRVRGFEPSELEDLSEAVAQIIERRQASHIEHPAPKS